MARDDRPREAQPEVLTPLLRERESVMIYDRSHVLAGPALRAILEAARWAPSAGNSQPWGFIVGLRGDDTHAGMVEVLSSANQIWAPAASAIILTLHQVATDEDHEIAYSDYAMFDLGQAVAHITVQARSMGLQVRQFGGFDHRAAAERFDVPPHWAVTTGIALGLPAEPGADDALPEWLRASVATAALAAAARGVRALGQVRPHRRLPHRLRRPAVEECAPVTQMRPALRTSAPGPAPRRQRCHCRGGRGPATESRAAASSRSRSRSAKSRWCHSSLRTMRRHSRTSKLRDGGQPSPSTGSVWCREGLVRQSVDDPAHGRHAVVSQGQHLVEGGPDRPVARDAGCVGHAVPRQLERVPGRRVAEDGPAHPGVRGEGEVAQGLDEGPLAVDRLVQQCRVEAPGPLDRRRPPPLDDVPRVAKAGGVGGSHLHPIRLTPVELGLDERRHVDAVEDEALELAVDVHVAELDATHDDVAHLRSAEHRPREVGVHELRAGQVDALEARPAEVLVGEVSHARTLAPPA